MIFPKVFLPITMLRFSTTHVMVVGQVSGLEELNQGFQWPLNEGPPELQTVWISSIEDPTARSIYSFLQTPRVLLYTSLRKTDCRQMVDGCIHSRLEVLWVERSVGMLTEFLRKYIYVITQEMQTRR